MGALDVVLWIVAAVIALLSMAGLLSRHWWIFDMASHLRTQYALGAGAVAVVGLLAASWGAAGFALITSLFNTLFVLPELPGRQRPLVRKEATLRVLFANVLHRNNAFERLARVVDAAEADVVVLAEVDADANAQIRLRLPRYPFFAQPTIGPRPLGIGLLSRRVPSSSRLVSLNESGSALVMARFDDLSRPITIIGAHPLPPNHPTWFDRRNAYLEKLAAIVEQEITEEGREVLLVGDFNLTPWTWYYDEFLRASGLRDSRAGFGLQTTWPAELPPLLRVAIDHCFVSSGITVIARCVLGSTGSDHLPIVVDISIREH